MLSAATTFTISGLHGWLYIFAVVLFLIAAIVAWFVQPKAYWPTCVALGLMCVALGFIVTS
jgi:hypothetical protein